METKTKNYLILTYGCQMNVHDSEKIAGILEDKGYVPCNDAVSADIVVFLTCAIRESAEQKIFGNIGELKNIKNNKPDMIIAIGGCMTQQDKYPEEIMKRYPYVDIIFGTHNLIDFEKFLNDRLNSGKKQIEIVEDEKISLRESKNISRTSGVNAWVNIMYGCNNFCTYCIVPYVRGREISRTEESILIEVENLLKQGYKQITLLGQNVNSYSGTDKNGNKVSFAQLLRDIDKFDYKFRLRFMTSHPKDLSSEVIEVIRDSKHICHAIHLPVQSGSTKVLKSMNRVYTSEKYSNLVNEIREKLPDCELTTDIIVGFPGETEEDFQMTLDIVRKSQYMQIFGFMYSKRRGTVAEKMENQVDLKTKKERLSRLLALKGEIVNKNTAEMLGKTYDVLVESFNLEKGLNYGSLESGKTISFAGCENLVGEFVDVKVAKVRKSVIYGELVDDIDFDMLSKKEFKQPVEISILPKDQKNLKILRENKQNHKLENDTKSRK